MADIDTRIFALHEELADAVNARRAAEQYLEDARRTNEQLRAAARRQQERIRAPELAVVDHLSVFSPLVGKTLADWLDTTADLHEARADGLGCQWCADEDWPCADVRQAVKVARAITLETLNKEN